MRLTYSFVALLILLPLCTVYACKSKQHWRETAPTRVEQRVEAPEAVPDVPRKVEPPKVEITKPKSYRDALNIAKSSNKKVLLYFSGERYCEPCRKMRATWADPKVRVAIASYVFYQIDVESPEANIAREKGVKGVPTYMIVNPDGKIEKLGTGYIEPENFIGWLNAVQYSQIVVIVQYCEHHPVRRAISAVTSVLCPCHACLGL